MCVMFNGPFDGHFLDDERFFPIFAKAAELDVPVYLHPTEASPEVRKYYYEGRWNGRTANTFAGFGIGWHYDTAMHLMRFILSGIFDKLPTLKMIVGHWGELLPYYFDRMNASMPSQMTGRKLFRYRRPSDQRNLCRSVHAGNSLSGSLLPDKGHYPDCE